MRRFVPGAYLLASRLDGDPRLLARYLAERLVPLAVVAAIHHRSATVAFWCALLWWAYLGLYELFYAWNDRRGIPAERRAPQLSIVSAGNVLWRGALMAFMLAFWIQVAPESTDPRPFLTLSGLVAVAFALHNLLGEQGRLGVRTATFGLLAALRFMAVAALLLPVSVLQVLWVAHLLADALPRTIDYRLRKARRMPDPLRLRRYRRLKLVGLGVGFAVAWSSIPTETGAGGGSTLLLLAVFTWSYPSGRLAMALVKRLSTREHA